MSKLYTVYLWKATKDEKGNVEASSPLAFSLPSHSQTLKFLQSSHVRHSTLNPRALGYVDKEEFEKPDPYESLWSYMLRVWKGSQMLDSSSSSNMLEENSSSISQQLTYAIVLTGKPEHLVHFPHDEKGKLLKERKKACQNSTTYRSWHHYCAQFRNFKHADNDRKDGSWMRSEMRELVKEWEEDESLLAFPTNDVDGLASNRKQSGLALASNANQTVISSDWGITGEVVNKCKRESKRKRPYECFWDWGECRSRSKGRGWKTQKKKRQWM